MRHRVDGGLVSMRIRTGEASREREVTKEKSHGKRHGKASPRWEEALLGKTSESDRNEGAKHTSIHAHFTTTVCNAASVWRTTGAHMRSVGKGMLAGSQARSGTWAAAPVAVVARRTGAGPVGVRAVATSAGIPCVGASAY